jgi:acetyl esterase/lipase
MPAIPRPPFDAECEAVLPQLNALYPASVTFDMINQMRKTTGPLFPSLEASIGDRRVEVTDRVIPGPPGAPDLTVSIMCPQDASGTLPAVYYTHGGGMFMGTRTLAADQLSAWVVALGIVVVSVEYRLAPEHPDPAPVEDCYAGLAWTADNGTELGVATDRVVIVGESAGGGLAAGTALLARDRGGPALAGQMLIYPMLDDRNDSLSSAQFDGVGLWDKTSNDTGWTALLGDRRGTDAVSPYAAPARASELSGLPSAFIDVSSTETFRDEAIAYAHKLWAAGVQAELHVWPGGFHGFDLIAPQAQISVKARAARTAWLADTIDR